MARKLKKMKWNQFLLAGLQLFADGDGGNGDDGADGAGADGGLVLPLPEAEVMAKTAVSQKAKKETGKKQNTQMMI